MNKNNKQIKINTASAHEITAMSLSCVKKKMLSLQIHLHVHVGIKLYTDLLFNVNNNVRL